MMAHTTLGSMPLAVERGLAVTLPRNAFSMHPTLMEEALALNGRTASPLSVKAMDPEALQNSMGAIACSSLPQKPTKMVHQTVRIVRKYSKDSVTPNARSII